MILDKILDENVPHMYFMDNYIHIKGECNLNIFL